MKNKIDFLKNNIVETLKLLENVSNNSKLDIVSVQELVDINNLYGSIGYYNSSYPRVFLMGEFKSGKSSLVNALIDKKYAPTDILEMTAWVSKFWKNDNDYCKIFYKNSEEKFVNTKEFITNCEQRKFDKDYFKGIQSVEFGIKGLEIDFILIDTPGFGSINTENEKKMLELIYEADIVLFIIDAESIGSLKEAALVKEHIKNGIPYFIVITKIDLIEQEKELDEIKSFIAKEYNADFEKILSVSAISDSSDNGLLQLKEKLSDYSQNFDSEKREEAELGFLKMISARLESLLGNLAVAINDIEGKVVAFNTHVESISGLICKSLMIDMEEYARNGFYQNKREIIVSEITNILENTGGEITKEQLFVIYQKHLGPDMLEFINNKVKRELFIKMKELWLSYLDEIKEKSIKVFSNYIDKSDPNNSLENRPSSISSFDIQLDKITEKTFARGIKGSLGFAGVLSAYAAWFGPSAAAVSLGTALTGVGIPIVVIGAGISGILAYRKRNQTKDNLKTFASDIADSSSSQIVQELIMPELSNTINNLNSEFSIAVKNEFFNDSVLGMDEDINLNKIRKLKSGFNV